MKAKLPWILAAGVALFSAAAAIAYARTSHRFELVQVGSSPIVARLDRQSGQVVFLSAAGKAVGSYPTNYFDSFDAVASQKP